MEIKKILEKIKGINIDVLGIKKDLKDALEIAKIRPDMSMASLRKILEKVLNDVYEKEYKQTAKDSVIQKVKNQLLSKGIIPRRIRNHIETIQDFGNMSIHHTQETIESEDLEMCFTAFLPIYKWYMETYNDKTGIKTDKVKKEDTSTGKKDVVKEKKEKQTNFNEKKSGKKKSGFAVFSISFIILAALAGIVYFVIIPMVTEGNTMTEDGVTPEDDPNTKEQNIIKLSAPLIILPSGVNNSSDSVYLQWDEVEGAESYEIYRSEYKDDAFKSLGEIADINYTDKTLEYPDYTYYYKVRAVSSDVNYKNSDFSSIKEIRTKAEANKWIEYNRNEDDVKPHARTNFAMSYFGDGKVILFGGKGKNGLLNDTWEYDIKMHKWTEINKNGDIPQRRWYHSMAYDNDGKIVLYGGINENKEYLSDCWVYDKSGWKKINIDDVKPSPIAKHSMSNAGDNKIALFGGERSRKGTSEIVYVFDTDNNNWKEFYYEGSYTRHFHTIEYLDKNKLFMFGGYVRSGGGAKYTNDTFEFNLMVRNSEWKTLVKKPKNDLKRGNHAVAYIKEAKKILMFGGYDGETVKHDTWLYSIDNGLWQKVPEKESGYPIDENRQDHSISYIGDGKVLMFGGKRQNELLADTWIYYIKDEFTGPTNQ